MGHSHQLPSVYGESFIPCPRWSHPCSTPSRREVCLGVWASRFSFLQDVLATLSCTRSVPLDHMDGSHGVRYIESFPKDRS